MLRSDSITFTYDGVTEFNFPNTLTLEKWPKHDISNLKAALVALKLILKHKENLEIDDVNNFLEEAIGVIALSRSNRIDLKL